MTQYMLSLVTPADGHIEPEQLEQVIKDVTALNQEMQSAGVWVFALPLAHPSTATVVSDENGTIALADGPFAELKEYVGGITVIDVSNLDAATSWAHKLNRATGLKIEVRAAAGPA